MESKYYFFDEVENEQLLNILNKNRFGIFVKVFYLTVEANSFKLNALWKEDETRGNIFIEDFIYYSNRRYQPIYDFLIAIEITRKRNINLRTLLS